jgi:hypothetical protein
MLFRGKNMEGGIEKRGKMVIKDEERHGENGNLNGKKYY